MTTTTATATAPTTNHFASDDSSLRVSFTPCAKSAAAFPGGAQFGDTFLAGSGIKLGHDLGGFLQVLDGVRHG